MAAKLDQIDEAHSATVDDEEQRRLQQIEANQPAIALLRSWRETTDPEEIRDQKETWEFLKQALDEDWLSYRKFFP